MNNKYKFSCVFLLISSLIISQNNKYLDNYNLASTNYQNFIKEQKFEDILNAKSYIDISSKNIIDEKKYDFWILKGAIYFELVINNQLVFNYQSNQSIKEFNPSLTENINFEGEAKLCFFESYKSLKKAYELTINDIERKNIEEYFLELINLYKKDASKKYTRILFANDYKNYIALTELDLFFKNNHSNTLVQEPETNHFKFICAKKAFETNEFDLANKLSLELIENNYSKPELYSILFYSNFETNQEMALKYLDSGKKKFPDNEEIIIAEYFLKAFNLGIKNIDYFFLSEFKKNPKDSILLKYLIKDKIKQAGIADAFSALTKAGYNEINDDLKTSLEYFETYKKANPKDFDTHYLFGNYFFESYRVKKYYLDLDSKKSLNEKKVENDLLITNHIDKALIYLKAAEIINPNDIDVLEKLYMIFDLKKNKKYTDEFYKRLENIYNDKSNSSFFLNKD